MKWTIFMHNPRIFEMLSVLFLFGPIFLASQTVSRRTPVVEVVERTGPSIVNISTEQLVKNPQAFEFEDIFNEFFRYHPNVSKTQSLGSGVIVGPSGFIVTNEHVIRRASKITVVLSNKNKLAAQLIASDPENDLALLKVKSEEPLPAIPWGDSSDILIGETAIALGNPFGLQNSVTTGVISATDRAISAEGKARFSDFLQTDAAINPGNSGGALVDIQGRFMGINCAIAARGQGLGFAIPVNRVRRVLGQLLDSKKIKKIELGFEMVEEENPVVWQVRVKEVTPNSPASAAGLKPGDIIERADEQPVAGIFEFNKVVYHKETSEILSLVVKSSGKRKNLSLKISPVSVHSQYLVSWKRMGILPAQRAAFVMVSSVKPGSSAARIGIEPGDVILSLGEYRVRSVNDLNSILEQVEPNTVVAILLERKGRRLGGNILIE